MRPLREAFTLVLRTPRLWVVQLLGNVLVFAAFALWLRLPEAHWWDLLLNLIMIALVVVGAVVLQGGTLNYCQSAHADHSSLLAPEFKKALKNFFAIAVWTAVFFLLWLLVRKLGDYRYSFPGYVRSELPSWLRKHTTDAGFTDAYMITAGMLLIVGLPGLLLPGALLAASQGFRGLVQVQEWGRRLRSLSYWVVLVVTVIPAGLVIAILLDWKLNPQTATLRGEEISLFFRLLACYLIGLFAWLSVCSMLGRLRRAGQPAA